MGYRFDFNPDKAMMLITVNAELGHGAWEALLQAFREHVKQQLLCWRLDLSDLRFLDTNGLSAVVAMLASLRTRGGALRVEVLSGTQPSDVFRVSKLDSVMTVEFRTEPRAAAMASPRGLVGGVARP